MGEVGAVIGWMRRRTARLGGGLTVTVGVGAAPGAGMSVAAAIRLAPTDNVAVCCRPVTRGERITVDDLTLIVADDVALGHKLALVPLDAGDKVLKYGMPIGSMTVPAGQGAWIHIHNMKSDYISAHLRDAQGDHA